MQRGNDKDSECFVSCYFSISLQLAHKNYSKESL